MENTLVQVHASGDTPQPSLETSDAQVQPRESTEDEVDLFDCFSDNFDDIDWNAFDRSTGTIPNECPITTDTADTAANATEDHATLATELEVASLEHDEDRNSIYSFEELDDTVFRELDAIEARFSQDPAAFRLSGSSSHDADRRTVNNGRIPEAASSSPATPSSSQQMSSTPRKSPGSRFSLEPKTPQRVSSSLPASPPLPSQETEHEPHEAVIAESSPRKRQHLSPFSPSKKGRLDDPEPSIKQDLELPSLPFPKDKGKGKEKSGDTGREELRHVLDGYEDEMSCPICCDLFISAHLVNPCGHSVCGTCGNDWIARQPPDERPTCPICRTKMIRAAPLIPNFSLDSAVERHVQALRETGVAGWGPGGAKLADWNRRKEEWKQAPARIDPPKKFKKKSRRRAQQQAQ